MTHKPVELSILVTWLSHVQLLEAVDFLHSHWIMSRDLKLPNLLLTNGGQLKICDFGLARYFHAFDEAYTPKVVTLWYRYGAQIPALIGCL